MLFNFLWSILAMRFYRSKWLLGSQKAPSHGILPRDRSTFRSFYKKESDKGMCIDIKVSVL